MLATILSEIYGDPLFSDPVRVSSIGRNSIQVLLIRSDPVPVAVSRKPRKHFGPVKPLQNLEPCEYSAVLVTYSKDEGRFPSYKKFRAYALHRF